MDSADAYDQPALLYRMSSAGMAKDPIHGHSTYYHETIILHRLFQLYILRLNIVGTFLSTCSFSTRPRTYKLLQASPYKLLDSKRTQVHLRVRKGYLSVLHKAPIYLSDCD